MLITALFNGVAVCLDILGVAACRVGRDEATDPAWLWLPAHAFTLLLVGGALGGADGSLFQLWCWALFVHIPLVLTAVATMRHGRVRLAMALVTLAVLSIGVDAFLIEPGALEVRTHHVALRDAERPVSIAVVADLHASEVTELQREALELVMDAEPDLILFAGDTLDAPPGREAATRAAMRRLLIDVGLDAPMGIYAVRGDADPDDWATLFEGIGRASDESWTDEVAPGIRLTALSEADASDRTLQAARDEGLHIVLGHSPDFSRGAVAADLLIAGHTHGGQLRIPGVGPVNPSSSLPRGQADGLSWIRPGQALVVARGVGLWRDSAPPMRLFCPPRVTLIEVVPGSEA